MNKLPLPLPLFIVSAVIGSVVGAAGVIFALNLMNLGVEYNLKSMLGAYLLMIIFNLSTNTKK